MICIPICHSTLIMNSFFVKSILKKFFGNEELCVTHLLFRKCFSGEKIYHKWWYFLKCDTQSYLSCYIQKLVEKDMFPITQKRTRIMCEVLNKQTKSFWKFVYLLREYFCFIFFNFWASKYNILCGQNAWYIRHHFLR